MKSKFKCFNCGKCCNSYYAQINATIGDIIRISDFMKKPISYILKNFIGINAFGDPENPTKFTYEFGINMPCKFRKDNRCSVYNARPLNCRLFPYWVLVQAFKSGNKDIIDELYECMKNLEINNEELKKYSDYVKTIGNILMCEGEITDEILNETIITLSIDLSDNKDYRKIVEKYKNAENTEEIKKMEQEKIRLAKDLFGNLNEAQIRLIKEKLKSLDLINKIRENTEKFNIAEDLLINPSIKQQQNRLNQ
jgi:Fe-S-cluster containining protein